MIVTLGGQRIDYLDKLCVRHGATLKNALASERFLLSGGVCVPWMRLARKTSYQPPPMAPDDIAGKGVQMHWLQHLRNWAGQSKIAEMADNVASNSFETVWQRVYPSVIGMSFEEARGYARARAAIVVSDKVELAVARLNNRHINQQRVYALALDAVVCRTVTHAMAQRSRPVATRQAA